MEALYAFLSAHSLLFLTLHILTMSIGLGGATIADILFFKFLKDFRLTKKEVEVLNIVKTIVLASIVLITVFGLAVYLPKASLYNASATFMAKCTFVLIIIINGALLHMFIAPYLLQLNLERTKAHRRWRRLAFALGSVSVVSWYSTFFLAMLKTMVIASYTTIILWYCAILLCGLIGSQIVEHVLTKRAQQHT